MPENNHIPAPYQVSVEVGGRALTLETGKIAKQANGAIVARYGDTVILNTACMATKANDKDFLPLTVDYRENTYSAGKIPGGFVNGQLVANPTVAEQKTSLLNIVIAGSEDAIMMVESGALEVSEETVVEALEFGHAQVKKIVAAIRELHAQLKPKKVEVAPWPFDQKIYDSIQKTHGASLKDALDTQKHPKKE